MIFYIILGSLYEWWRGPVVPRRAAPATAVLVLYDGHRFDAAGVVPPSPWLAVLPVAYRARRNEWVEMMTLRAFGVQVFDYDGRSYWPPEPGEVVG
jgi:hypothetical protein